MDHSWIEMWSERLSQATSLTELDDLRVALFGKQGDLTRKLKSLGTLPSEDRKRVGEELNRQRDSFQEKIRDRHYYLSQKERSERLSQEGVDLTLPSYGAVPGTIHPLSTIIESVSSFFFHQGFVWVEGDEIENDFYNFEGLNFSEHHPARQSHDTFYLKDFPFLLRTHTSTVQLRFAQKTQPPLRMLAPGRVYRNDALDATHTPMFHQLEGLVIEPGIHMGHLKGCLWDFCKDFFDVDPSALRLRPSFFPFTEPSAEVDVRCARRDGGLFVGEGDDWLEVLGCGMVHPHVIRHMGYDPKIYQGFAFGIGIERLVMLKMGLSDIRSLYESDHRWLQHYGASRI